MRQTMERISGWLAQATVEERAVLYSLRTSITETNSLAEALKRSTDDCSLPRSMALTFVVIGDAREMHPIIRDEIYRIGFEAIRNASVHSSASQLEIELTYSQTLTLRVADNGGAIASAVINQGKQGHFGLQGMRERAARIGSTLDLTSSADAGTEIKLVVPGTIAFQTQKTNSSDPADKTTRLGSSDNPQSLTGRNLRVDKAFALGPAHCFSEEPDSSGSSSYLLHSEIETLPQKESQRSTVLIAYFCSDLFDTCVAGLQEMHRAFNAQTLKI
jgi:hypothetical protein